jgi:threonine-phosphate decarboxylase
MNDHGGQVWDSSGTLGDWLDFSANTWPEPAPAPGNADWPRLLAAYPDHDCVALRQAAAGFYGVSAGQIVAANGSTEALYYAMQMLRPQTIAICEPTFSEYARAARWASPGARAIVTAAERERDFVPRLEVPRAEVAVLANPNNPTGTLIPRRELLDWIDACNRRGVWVILDEAFIEFAENTDSVAASVGDRPQLIVLRSATKRFGCAGLRLGFAIAAEATAKLLGAARIPWSVNTVAQQIGTRLLSAGDDGALARRISVLRDDLTQALKALGWQVWPSAANFLLCRLPGGCSNRDLLAQLRGRGLLLRDGSTFATLDDSYVRCAVRPAADNRRLITALDAIGLSFTVQECR